jgi:hypothetical protein
VKKHITQKATSKSLSKVVQIDEAKLQDHLGTVVRNTVEHILNQMLDAEADELCGAKRYE